MIFMNVVMNEEIQPSTESQDLPAIAHGAAAGVPELKQVIGGLLFAAHKPLSVSELRAVLTGENQDEPPAKRPFGQLPEREIRAAIEQLKTELAERKLGIVLAEVAGRFGFQTDPAGGPWVRQLLNLDKPAHLSKPALETLAIIAYRQPITRAQIEAVRGVNVDAMMRNLLELQLVRITGRSDLPGRPLLYGTTNLFLEHFGLSSVKNLPGIEQLSQKAPERLRSPGSPAAQSPAAGPAAESPAKSEDTNEPEEDDETDEDEELEEDEETDEDEEENDEDKDEQNDRS